MKIYIFTLLLLFSPIAAFAQSTMVQSSGVYTGPLQTQASPVVVELFSSQNCPACPPADEYMQSLAKSKGVIALSCHVDYFGKTGAGLEQAFCTERQTRYIAQIGRKSHFTPQMMINGHMSEIGYETANVAAAIVKGRSERVARIDIQPKTDKSVFNFTLPALQVSGVVELWIAVYKNPQAISYRGQTKTYTNVMNRFLSLGAWHGNAANRTVYPLIDPQSAGFAIVAQDVRSGKILAAGDYKL